MDTRRSNTAPRSAPSAIATALGLAAAAMVAAAFIIGLVRAQPTGSVAAVAAPYDIQLLVSSDGNRCYRPGLVAAIKHFTAAAATEINASGGIHGRPIALSYSDDYEDGAQTIANVKAALAKPNLLALIGIPSSTRGQGVFDAVGTDISRNTLPFVTEMSNNTIFGSYPSVFTMASAVGNELATVRAFLKREGVTRPLFVGVDNDLYSFALGDGVANIPGGPALAGSFQVPVRDYKLGEDDARAVAEKIAAADPDLILFSIHSRPTATVLAELQKLGVSTRIFVLLGRVATIAKIMKTRPYEAEMMQMAREGVPNVYNERLRQRIWRARDQRWVFEDEKEPSTPGWASGACEEKVEASAREIFDAGNRRAVGRGTQYRDVLQLIVNAARQSEPSLSLADMRAHISERLGAFTEGQEVLKGLWQDWAFTADRTAAGDTLILSKRPDARDIVLAPMQFQRIAAELIASPVVYLTLDLISIARVNANDKSFDAEFYLSMKSRDNAISIDDIEFTNAYRSQASEGRLLSHAQIHDGSAGSKFPSGTRLYKVSGKFTFEPDLAAYPFDTQRLSVSFQPASAKRPFQVQPPPPAERETALDIDGWQLLERYVGSDQDIIPVIDGTLDKRRIVPFYKFNTTWIVKRTAVDYYLRVVIPLGFILLVTYFSVFLPRQRFESIMAIQVTALLSAIALYLALPNVDSDQATLSDKIFMMTYASVSLMIGLSILKDNVWPDGVSGLGYGVSALQFIIFPLGIMATTAFLLNGGSTAEGFRDIHALSNGIANTWSMMFASAGSG